MKKILFIILSLLLINNSFAQIITTTTTGGHVQPDVTAVGYQTQDNFMYADFCDEVTSPILNLQGSNVKALQSVLRYQIFPSLSATGYYGSVTKSAVQIFQKKYGITQTGHVGPQTLAKMRSLWCQFNYTNTSTINPTVPIVNPIINSTSINYSNQNNFMYADFCDEVTSPILNLQGSNVRALQSVLKYQGIFPNLATTGYYGSVTKSAVQIFQKKYGITQTGHVGPQTLAKMRSLWCQFNYTNTSTINPTVPIIPITPTVPIVNPVNTVPVVSFFKASSNSISEGQSVLLSWDSINANYCTLNSTTGDQQTLAASGNVVVTPTSTSIYSLTCTNSYGTSQSYTQTGTIGNNLTSVPTITSFTSSSNNINPSQSITLSWNSTNANSCTIVSNPGSSQLVAVSGSQSFNPTTSTIYTLTCTNSQGSSTAATQNINTSSTNTTQAPFITSFTASSNSINSGQAVSFTWNSINANTCSLVSNYGYNQVISASGSITVNPTTSSTYNLTCSNNSGVSNPSSQSINVNTIPAGTISVTPASTMILSGNSTNLILTTTNMTSCNVNGGSYTNNSINTNSTLSVNPTATTTYLFTCIGNNGQTYTAQSIVNITNSLSLPALPVFSPSANTYTSTQTVTITSGNSASIRYTTNGTDPTCTTGNLYTTPIAINSTQTVKAIGCNSIGASSIATALYTLNLPTPALPVFSPSASTYDNAQTVAISSVNSSSIRYTTNGTDPTCTTGNLYTTPIVINSTQTVKAIGCNSVGPSTVATGIYTINYPAGGTPVFSPIAGSYNSPQTVTVTSSGSNLIKYTLDGSNPTCTTGTTYSSPITINLTQTVKAIGCNNGFGSAIKSALYTITVPATPVATPTAFSYNSVQLISLTSNGATSIRYTTDNSNPTCTTGTLYVGTITVSSTQTIKAVGCNAIGASPVFAGTYTISYPASGNPSFSPVAGSYTSPQNVTITALNSTSIRYTTDGTTPTCTAGSLYTGPVNISISQTIRAIACNQVGSSPVINASYTITAPATPVASPVGTTYYIEKTISLSSSGATSILYTTDGTNPTCSTGNTYTTPISINTTQTIKAIGCNNIGGSTVGTFPYTLNLTWPQNPTANPVPGSFASSTSVSLSSLRSTSIRYTTSGTVPSCTTGSLYASTSPITLTDTTTIKAIGCNPSGSSDVIDFVYTKQ